MALMVMVLVAGCGHGGQVVLLAEAEAFLPCNPDSASAVLTHVRPDLLRGEEEKAYYALVQTVTDGMHGKTPLDGTLAKRAYTYYKRRAGKETSVDPAVGKHFGQAALYMGDWHSDRDSTRLGEQCYREAIAQSEEAGDWHTCYRACSRLASLVQWTDEREAVRLAEKAIDMYGRSRDNVNNLVSLYEQAADYCSQIAHMHGTDSAYRAALDYAHKACRLAKDSCPETRSNASLATLAEIYWSMGERAKTLECVRNINPGDLETVYAQKMNMKMAQYYMDCDSLDRARQIYMAPGRIDDKLLKYLYARGLAEVAIRQGLPGDTIMQCMDSAFKSAEENYLGVLQTKYAYYHEVLEGEKRNARLVYEGRLRTWVFAGIICIVLAGGLLLYIEERRRAKSKTMFLQELHRRKEQEADFLQKEMSLLREKQQAMEVNYQRKSAIIRHLQNFIIDRTDITLKLKEDTPRVNMSAKDWSDVEQLLNEIDDGVFTKIRARYKGMSTDDIRLCIMVRLGMSNPAIGNVYAITPSAVQHRKRTLKQRCFGNDDPSVTLYDFICSL